MTLLQNLAIVHNIYYSILPIIFWIFILFYYTRKMACTDGQTSVIMGLLLFLIIFMTCDIIYCSILLGDKKFTGDPAYDSIKPSIIVSLVTSVIGVLASILQLYAIRAGTFCGVVERVAAKVGRVKERAGSVLAVARGKAVAAPKPTST